MSTQRITVAILLLACAAGACGYSFISFDSMRAYLDSLSGDGSAEPYTNLLHDRVTTFAFTIGLVCAALSVFIVVLPEKWIDVMACRSRTHVTWRACKEVVSGEVSWLIGLTIVATAVRIPYMFDAIRFDEAFTYLNYASRPFFIVVATYGDPNNHVFHTLCVHLATAVLGHDEWALRLPAFVAGVLLVPATYLATLCIASRPAAIAAATIVLSSSILVEYSVLARGYSLVCLFTVLLIITVREIESERGGWEWGILVVLSALGLWTLPTMVYPLVLVWGWLLCRVLFSAETAAEKRRFLIRWSVAGVSTGVVATLFYAPILVATGYSAITANQYVAPIGRHQFLQGVPGAIRETCQLLFRDWTLLSQGLLAACLMSAVGSMVTVAPTLNRRALWFSAVVPVALLMAIVFWQSVLPPPRVWLFLLPMMSVFVGVGWGQFLEGQPTRFRVAGWSVWCLSCVSAVVIAALQHSERQAHETPDAERVALWLARDADQSPVLSVSPLSSPIVYYTVTHSLSLEPFAVPSPKELANCRILVSHEQGQTPSTVFEGLGMLIPHGYRPVEVEQFETISVFRLRRVKRGASE